MQIELITNLNHQDLQLYVEIIFLQMECDIKMAVNITYPFCDVHPVHISERISKTKIYCCPYCGEAMVARKGAVNAHHFSHKSDSSCDASEETILHLLA